MRDYIPSAWSPWKDAKGQLALGQLLAVIYYARDLQRTAWDFAVEIESLKAIGLTANDLRWLSDKAYINHAIESGNSRNGHRRRFSAPSPLAFAKRSCVVLTDAGIVFARCVCWPPTTMAPDHEGHHPPATSLNLPRWDRATRMLWFGSRVVKRFKLPAPNQERILTALQEEGWPKCIDDPLPPTSGVNSKRRLHDTIVRLNRSHRHHLIRFLGNGNGLAVHWERVSTGATSHTRARVDTFRNAGTIQSVQWCSSIQRGIWPISRSRNSPGHGDNAAIGFHFRFFLIR